MLSQAHRARAILQQREEFAEKFAHRTRTGAGTARPRQTELTGITHLGTGRPHPGSWDHA